MKEDLVSIIMPSYNCGQYVEESVRSVLAQTYKNWELIFVDDCSSDDTINIIKKIQLSDKRIKLFQNQINSGAAVSRNNALKEAKGRWIAFLDSDDLWEPTKLEKQVAFMEENGYAFSYTGYQEIDEDSKETGVVITGPRHVTKAGMFAFCWPGCLTVMYDASKIGLIQIADIKKNNDYAMWLKVIKKADCYLLDECLAKYRRGRKGSISNHSYFELIKWHYKLFRDSEGMNPVSSAFMTCVNLVCGVYKKIRYVKKAIMIICFFAFFILGGSERVFAQQEGLSTDSNAVVTNSFWDNWYGQVGADMILLLPVDHAIKDVFPNGKSLGMSIAVGKWFSPEFGGSLKVNWNNGILRDNHNIWYYPYGVKGGSHHEGGFVTFSGDIQLNLHNLFDVYKPERKWNLSLAPRAGGWIRVGDGKGCPILGVGINNTYRLNDRWKLFADINYTFVASINGVFSGTDHGGNGYAEINAGIEMDLSKNNAFHRAPEKEKNDNKAVVLNTFWENWFVQAGLCMSLQNPYGTNFSNVFPNGNTFGVSLGLGKWFTPDIGVRGGVNWQNSIITNHHAYYLAPKDDPKGELDKKGFYALYADVFFNLHNIIAGYDEYRKWNAVVFPRMGLATNFSSSYSECPMIGLGTEQTFAITDKLKLYADVAYQVMTSGFHDKKYKTPNHGISSNGWLDIAVGVQYDLGNNKWKK